MSDQQAAPEPTATPVAEPQATGAEAATTEPAATAPAVEEESEEDLQLREQLRQLDEELRDADAEYHAVDEDIHARANAEERLRAKQGEVDEAKAEFEREDEARVALETRAAGREELDAEYTRLRKAEDEYDSASFAQLWSTTVAEDLLTELVAAEPEDGIATSEIAQRLTAAIEGHQSAVRAAADKKKAQEEATAGFKAKCESSLAEVETELQRELRRLRTLRSQLVAMLDEQRFHIKRGTHLKPPAPVHSKKHRDAYLQLEQAKEDHSKLSADLNETEYLVKVAEREFTELQREHKHFLAKSANEKAALTTGIDALKQEVEEIDWEVRTLQEENNQLRDLRRGMIRAQANARQQLRQ